MKPDTTLVSNWQKRKIKESLHFQTKAFEEVNELIIKKRTGRKLILSNGNCLIDFMSCSYLGLDFDERIIKAASDTIGKCGVTFPIARTRAKVESFDVLEGLLNEIFCHSFTTIFSSIHLAHLGFLPMLGSGELPSFPMRENGCYFILDKNVHASVQINRALMGQFGRVDLISFDDVDQLQFFLSKAEDYKQTPVLLVDGIGSMGGAAPAELLYTLAEKYDGYLYIDDSHGVSVFGKHGCGYVLSCFGEKFPPRLILTPSLSKAFGAVGGVIALPKKEDADMLKRFCQTYIFSGPLPLAIIDSAIAAANIHLSDELKVLQDKLWQNVDYFDSIFKRNIINSGIKSPIRGIYIGDEFKAIEKAKFLQKKGVAVITAMYPTVAKGKSMLRVALSAKTSKDEINYLHKVLSGTHCMC